MSRQAHAVPELERTASEKGHSLMEFTGKFSSRSGLLKARISTAFCVFLSWAREVAGKEHIHTHLNSINPGLSSDIIRILSKVRVSEIATLRR